jgi:hypothetical protein
VYRDGIPAHIDTSVDIYAPSTTNPFHDAAVAPVAANLRHWVRTYSPDVKDYVTIVVEDRNNENLCKGKGYQYVTCESGFCSLWDADQPTMIGRFSEPLKSINFESRSSAYTLNMYGAWPDPRANLVLFVTDEVFKTGKNDVQHEIGHVLGGLDHPPLMPEWFYDNEVVRSGAANSDVLTHNTNHKIFVGAINGNEFYWKELPTGHGGAIRNKIASDPIMQHWMVGDLEAGQSPW